MARLPVWMPALIRRINGGLQASPLLRNLLDDSLVISTGRTICRDMWPFIRELPDNISRVRDRLPSEMEAACRLLNQLADDERYYQSLFLRQCELAGLTSQELENHRCSPASQALCSTMRHFSSGTSFEDGIYAITAAELAATAFARASLPRFEGYFKRYTHNYDSKLVADGLKWLRLHARPHTRHARWLTRMLKDMKGSAEGALPGPVDQILQGVYLFWQLPADPFVSSRARIEVR